MKNILFPSIEEFLAESFSYEIGSSLADTSIEDEDPILYRNLLSYFKDYSEDLIRVTIDPSEIRMLPKQFDRMGTKYLMTKDGFGNSMLAFVE